MKPGTAGKGKLDERWGDGVFLGTIGESSGICIGTKDGIVKARTFARRGEEDRWSRKEVDEMVGVPWEQILGKGMREANSRAHIAGAGAGEDIIAAPQMRETMPRRMRFDMDDLEKHGFTVGCPGCKAKNRGETGVNHSEECRQRIEEKIRIDDPERYNRTLGSLAEGPLKGGTLKGDERKAKDIEVKKKLKQKEDRKEERKEEIKRKAEGSKGEHMDTKGTWICPKCKTTNQESYKFCMECADRNPKRGLVEVASGHAEPPAYRRKTVEEQKENHRKRKAEEGSIIEEEKEGRVKNGNMEEMDQGKLQKENGETTGTIDKTMNVDMMEEEDFQERKADLRENKVPLVILQGKNWKRIAQMGEIQSNRGEFYLWEMPRQMNTANINKR